MLRKPGLACDEASDGVCWVRCRDVILAQIAIPIGRRVKQYLHLKLVSSNFQRIEIQSTQNTAPAAAKHETVFATLD